MSGNGFSNRFITQRRIILAILLAWSATIGGLAWWYEIDHDDNLSEMARIYARACHEKDMIYRQWNAAHGAYAQRHRIKTSQPNPNLQAADRDVNPARQVQESVEDNAMATSMPISRASSLSTPTMLLISGNKTPCSL